MIVSYHKTCVFWHRIHALTEVILGFHCWNLLSFPSVICCYAYCPQPMQPINQFQSFLISFKTLKCTLSVGLKSCQCFCCSVAGLWRWRFAQSAKSISAVQDITSLKGILQLRGMALGYSLWYVNDWKHFLHLLSDRLTDWLPSTTKLSVTFNCLDLIATSNHAVFWFVELIVPWQVTCLAILVPGLKVLLQNGICHLWLLAL